MSYPRPYVNPPAGLRTRLFDELAWLRFVVPRQAVQLLAARLPLARIRDALPAPIVKRLRVGLYPARVEATPPRPCARTHPDWGDPAELAPTLRVRNASTPRVSILMVTHGNLALTRLCLASLQRAKSTTAFELIVVDNASTDGSPQWLRDTEASRLLPLTIVCNAENAGFARATNQAARLASGEVLVFLNNDTVVTDGWLEPLLAHLDRDPTLGLIAPSTNSCGHPVVEVPTSYETLPAMATFAREQSTRLAGHASTVDMVPLFCAAMDAQLFTAIGGLDEAYGVGMFEDDDLAEAVRRRGLRVAVARDSFVHHYGGASFGRLEQTRYLRIFWENRRRFEAKWNVRWKER